MKKNLALILALVMLMGTIFSVLPVAAASDASAYASYEPKVSYANINYSDKLYMMFAVPAPAALNAGDTVDLLVWNGVASEAYSLKDTNVEILSAEADKVTIGEAQYLVFKYDGLTAADMTKIISARPVIINTWEETVKVEISPEEKNEAGEVIKEAVYEDKIEIHKDAVVYGDLVEYSVLEYVATAKGEFGGTALADDVLAMLDAMLVFGGLAQKYSTGSYDFLADDELGKIWYTPVINGVAGEKVFGGFFKKGADFATVEAPHYDDYDFVAFVDAEGNEVYDADGLADNGTQVFAPVDGDLELVANYGPKMMVSANPNDAIDRKVLSAKDLGTGNNFNHNIGGLAFQAGSAPDGEGDFTWFSLSVVQDPFSDDPEENTYRIASNHSHMIALGNSTNDWKFSMKPSAVPGFGDTAAAIATIDFTIARGPDGEMPPTGRISIRSNSNKNISVIGNFNNEGYFLLRNDNPETEGIFENIVCPTPVAENGYTRYCLIIDFASEIVYVYASNADGELVYQAQSHNIEHYTTGTHHNASWMSIAATLDRIEFMGDRFAGVKMTAEEKEMLADLDGDGVGETPMYTGEGDSMVVNKAAVEWFHNNYRSFYMKEFKSYVGSPVELLANKVVYDVDTSKATTTVTNNFGTSKLSLQYDAASGLSTNGSDFKSNNGQSFYGFKPVEAHGSKVVAVAGNEQLGTTIILGKDVNDYKASCKLLTKVPGFGTETYPMFTVDLVIGGTGYDRMRQTGSFALRDGATTKFYVNLGYLNADGNFYIYEGVEKDENGANVAFASNASIAISKTGYTRIVFQFDLAREIIGVYSCVENGTLQWVTAIDASEICMGSSYAIGGYKDATTYGAWADWALKLDRTEWAGDKTGANAVDLTNEYELNYAIDTDGDGVKETKAFDVTYETITETITKTVIDETTGEETTVEETVEKTVATKATVANAEAAAAFYYECRALLIKDFDIYVGPRAYN